MASDESPGAALRFLIWGNMTTQALAAVARLDVAEALGSGALPIADLAVKVGAHEDGLYRVLRALASVGVFVESAPRVFANNATSDLLRADARPSMKHLALLNGGDLYSAWGGALESVRTGKSVFHLQGTTHYDHLAGLPEEQALFNAAMAGAARALVDGLLSVDWSGVERVVDVGGGDGTLMIALLQQKPELTGGVFDLPQVVDAARAKIAQAGLRDRCLVAAGSFLETDPPEADVYVLARTLHNWDDAQAKVILGRCRSAMRPGGRLVVLDEVIAEDNSRQAGKMLDLQMLVVVGGRERTRSEWETLFASAGLVLASVRPGPAGAVIEARATRAT